MSIKLFKTIVALSCLSTVLTPAMADGIGDVFKNQNQARAGVYFRLPFAGGLKKTDKNQLNYGFAMGFGRSQAGSSMVDAHRTFNADVIKLNFNTDGFNSFNVGGQDIVAYSDGQLNFLKNDEGGWHWTNVSLVITGVVFAAIGYELLKTKKCPQGLHLRDGYCVHIDEFF